MCKCINIIPGTYGNQVVIYDLPEHIKKFLGAERDSICVDTCLADEVRYLWSLGITTTGCCCGHNYIFEGLKRSLTYIGVIDSDIDRMKSMGYEVHPNNMDLTREDSFTPKTIY